MISLWAGRKQHWSIAVLVFGSFMSYLLSQVKFMGPPACSLFFQGSGTRYAVRGTRALVLVRHMSLRFAATTCPLQACKHLLYPESTGIRTRVTGI